MGGTASGHRSVPHTADLRIEAWSPTRAGCIGQAVLGAVESFLDTSSAPVQRTHRTRVTGDSDDDLLAAALEEVIYLLGIDVALTMVDARPLSQVGAVPKAVSLNDLDLSHSADGWRCAVTLDV